MAIAGAGARSRSEAMSVEDDAVLLQRVEPCIVGPRLGLANDPGYRVGYPVQPLIPNRGVLCIGVSRLVGCARCTGTGQAVRPARMDTFRSRTISYTEGAG